MSTSRELFNEFTPALGATAVGGDPDHMRFMVGAHVAHLHHTAGKHPSLTLEVESIPHTPRRDELPIEVPQPPLIELVAEGSLERLGKALGLNHEYQSGDPVFDDLVYIHHNGAPDKYINHLLQHPNTCDAIMRLLQAGHPLISVDAQARGGVVRVVAADPATRFGDAEGLRRQAALMAVIADAIPGCAPQRAERRPERGHDVLVSVFAWTFLSVIFAWAVGHMWPVHGPSWLIPWWGAGAIWLGATLALPFALRGGSRALPHLIGIALCLAVALPCTLVPGLRMLNALADLKPPRVAEAAVTLRVEHGRGRTPSSYYAMIDLKDGLPAQEYTLSRGDHAALRRCAPGCRVALGGGALGWPWISGYHVAAAGPSQDRK